jgi:hypothetical protein
MLDVLRRRNMTNEMHTLVVGFAGVLVGSITSILVVVIQTIVQARRDRANAIINLASELSRIDIERHHQLKMGGGDQFAVYYTQLASAIMDSIERKLPYQDLARKRSELTRAFIEGDAEPRRGG